MFRIFKVIKEINLFRDYLKTVKKESLDSPIWAKRNLRVDWMGRIYTVINLPPEVIFAEDIPKESRPAFVLNEIKPINEYLRSLDFVEIITPSIVPVEGTNDESYLIVYQFLFRHLTLLWILRFILELSGLGFLIYYFS
jgi:hypothetical protein